MGGYETLAQKATAGLRERQKQQRRDAIMESARLLFERQGIEDCSMATIAAEAGVSTPTVFNYFGSRDELLLAIILQGHQNAIADYRSQPRKFTSLADDVCELLTGFTTRSLEIFSKRVWRYADSTAIRYPESEFVQRYGQIDITLTKIIEDLLVARASRTRRGDGFAAGTLASVIYNHWNCHCIAYIKDEQMTIEEHLSTLLAQIRHLLDLIFAED